MWKENPELTRKRYERWWRREDLILSTWESRFPVNRRVWPTAGPGPTEPSVPRIAVPRIAEPPLSGDDYAFMYTDPTYLSARQRYELSRCVFPADMVPFAYTDKGTVSLAPMLGSPIHFSADTIWYGPSGIEPGDGARLVLSENAPWWENLKTLAGELGRSAAGDFLCGMPSVSPGLDVLSELRGAQNLCMDLAAEPEWVKTRLTDIDEAAIAATKTLYDLCRDDDGWVFHAFFMIWAPGMAGLCQCDFAALISPSMFEEFAMPSIRRYCDFLDYSLHHVDGPQALHTVDMLLDIEALDCIEFTPGPKAPQGGDPRWYELYRKIKRAGKCVQAVEMRAEEVIPLLDAVGPEGMYLMVNFRSEAEIEHTAKAVEPYRKE